MIRYIIIAIIALLGLLAGHLYLENKRVTEAQKVDLAKLRDCVLINKEKTDKIIRLRKRLNERLRLRLEQRKP
jgi:hypothetical protein